MAYQPPQRHWPAIDRRMTDVIHSEVKDMIGQSRLVRQTDGICLVHRHEVQLGDLLGQGAFSEVHRVRVSRQGHTATLAMKHLKLKLLSQPDNFRLAAGELAIEAHMLASFDHPNIVKIHGWAANGVASFMEGGHDSFFLLLDCLEETLDQRIERWKQQEARQAAVEQPSLQAMADWFRRMDAKSLAVREQERQLLEQERHLRRLEKLGVCTEIASALAYLHSKSVIFRDLKPNNIGFLNGRVKLFDFGLSRELPDCDLTQPFEMSGKVGTLRYMAVEVACHRPYNVSADVFSWAMVGYEVLTGEKPFAGWTRDMHANLVCGRGVRPDASGVARPLRSLLEQSWAPTPSHRPSMPAVCHAMRALEEEELLTMQAASSQGAVVELPQDFDLRKAPPRNHSAFTGSTCVSTASLELYE